MLQRVLPYISLRSALLEFRISPETTPEASSPTS